LKGLKNILPKANYLEHDDREEPGSCKSIKKEIESKKEIPPVKDTSLEDNERKLKEFLEKRRQLEEK
jgi:hypothetical protein